MNRLASELRSAWQRLYAGLSRIFSRFLGQMNSPDPSGPAALLRAQQLLDESRRRAPSVSGTPERVAYQTLLAIFELKAGTTLGAIQLLLSQRYADDATVLTRSVFELWLQAAYMEQDPEARARLYVEHDVIVRKRQADILRRRGLIPEPGNMEQERKLAELDEEAADLEKAGKRNVHRWSEKSIREMAEGIGLVEQYETVYSLLSVPTHSGSPMIKDYLTDTPEGLVLSAPTDPARITQAAILAATYAVGLVEVKNRALKLNLDAQIESYYRDFREER